ncbi:AAA family ATPase [Cryobacterium algoritolerans]|uniref:AAA family ATPase n=1 Tax=Cryobacterium algoritolerans TaxID=1259184 RepID=A0A4R8WL88_9MICO|nr:FtsK/SpoIIIE domain-containing protein [Cryobacterium algoritolerans]TFC09874.1 AAA family ATPase [Cryobacterium algoritolerans]
MLELTNYQRAALVFSVTAVFYVVTPTWLQCLALAAGLVASGRIGYEILSRRARSRGSDETLWLEADARTLGIVETLQTPRLINHELYNAKLFIEEKPRGIAWRRSQLTTSMLGKFTAMIRARAVGGRYTVDGKQLTVPRLVSIARTSVGPVALFTAIPGATEHDYDFASDILEVSMRVGEIRVEQLPEDRARGVMRMTFVVNDPLREKIQDSFFSMHPASAPMLLPLARTEEGSVYSLPVHHTLIVGATGSGKGAVIQAAVKQLAPWQSRGYVQIFGADPKRAELRGFEGSSLFDRVAFDFDDAAEMVHGIVTDVLKPRQKKSGRTFELSKENPLVVLIIDELSSLTQDKNYVKSGLYEDLNVILSQGRSDGVYVLAATQTGHKEVLGSLRQHFANRIALRVESAVEVDMVLGAGSMALGAKPHLIAKANESNGYMTAGVAYVNSDESPNPLRIRFPYTSDLDIQRTLDEYPAVPWLRPGTL